MNPVIGLNIAKGESQVQLFWKRKYLIEKHLSLSIIMKVI